MGRKWHACPQPPRKVLAEETLVSECDTSLFTGLSRVEDFPSLSSPKNQLAKSSSASSLRFLPMSHLPRTLTVDQCQSELRQQEQATLENSLTYLLSNRDFNRIQSPREKAKILTQKVRAIQHDYQELRCVID